MGDRAGNSTRSAPAVVLARRELSVAVRMWRRIYALPGDYADAVHGRTRRRSRLAGCCASAAMLLAAAAPAAALPAAQPSGRAGCADSEGTHGCAAAPSLAGLAPDLMVVAPDGRFVYAWQQELQFSPGAPHARLLAFARDPRSGALRALPGRRGCLENTARPVARQRGPCERVGGLEQPVALAISPDGRRLYASGRGGRGGGDYLVTFAVNRPTGALRRLQCLTDEPHSHCAFAALPAEGRLLIAPDSRTLDVGDGHEGVIDVYRVDAGGVALEQCLAAAPPPGRSCAIAPLLGGAVEGLAQSADGSELYAAGPLGAAGAERIVALVRDPAGGLLAARSAPGSCVSDEPQPPAGCAAVAVTGSQLSLGASGETLYAAGTGGYTGASLAIAAFARDPVSGAFLAPVAGAECVIFATASLRGCTTAPRWSGDFPYTLAGGSGGLLASAVEHRDDAGTVVQVTRSSGGGLTVGDVRGCGAGACHRLRGSYGELVGAIALSPDGRSIYVADGDGVAQLRMPR